MDEFDFNLANYTDIDTTWLGGRGLTKLCSLGTQGTVGLLGLSTCLSNT